MGCHRRAPATVRRPALRYDGAVIELHTQQVAGGAGRLVFLHGLFGRGKNFMRIAKAMSTTHTSLLVDLPNHGASPWTETFDYLDMADCVAANLRADFARHGAVDLVGHSMGGKVAMLVALRHPDLVASLVVVDMSPVRAEGSEDFPHLLGALAGLDLSTLQSRTQADELLKPEIPALATRGFLLQNLRAVTGPDGHRGFAWQPNLRLLHDSLSTIAGFPDPHAPAFGGPVLWVAGERSSYVLPEYEPRMRELFPHTTKITIKGSGHWVHAEKPEAFVSALQAFFTRTGRQS